MHIILKVQLPFFSAHDLQIYMQIKPSYFYKNTVKFPDAVFIKIVSAGFIIQNNPLYWNRYYTYIIDIMSKYFVK